MCFDEMKEGSRSGPFGCLIVKKKGLEPKEKRRKRLILHDSESDEDLFVTPPPTVIHNNPSRDEVEIDRKRKSGGVLYRDEARHDRKNKLLEVGTERKRSRIDDVGCSSRMLEERRTEIGRNGVLISKARVPVAERREFASDREHRRFDRSRDFPIKQERESVGVRGDKLGANDGKTIRVQGKNGVLKVMPSNKNKVGTSENCFGIKKEVEDRKGSKSVEYSNGKTPVSSQLYSEKSHEKLYPVVVKEEKQLNSSKKLAPAQNEVHDRRARFMESSLSQESKKSLSPCNLKKEVCNKKQKSLASEPMKPCMSSRLDKGEVKHATDTDKQVLQKQLNMTSLCLEHKDVGSCSSKKEVSNKKQKLLTSEPCTSSGRKEGEVKRGNGTEKQLLREQIREMLVNAGWTIDLRPRRNRDYQDSVYINPSGTEFWSITKAYYAFQKNVEDKGGGQKNSGDFSSFTLIPDDVLSMLTRKTRKKMERETKLQQKADRGSKNLSSEKKLKKKHVNLKTIGVVNEEKMKSHVTQDGKSLKMRIKGNSVAEPNSENSAKSKIPTSSNIGSGNREKSKQSGRALLVRGSGNGLNMEPDDFVPYTGKRTVLSWLIDMETVPLSGKVQYMNKKRTRAMLEGWITRDGIHCRCCSKILTISKFELHAGSKLHQPFQNIILENGVSLYQCQLDAWNRQDKSARCGFHYIDVDGDDPNDDTCGICGDGGDLICCDGCPSTFHQSCLNIQMLPSGDWLCPNCSCKFCGGVDLTGQEEEGKLCSCHLCEKKYHRLCRQQTDNNFIGSDSSRSSFCGKACEELFQELQKLLGVKHELDAGFSWTLIQRFNVDSDASCHGPCQKAEFNSKIAVALTVMDECFLPVIDQRSGVNLIQNVLYNVGSNFNRVNYSGFYTAVLERGDEIIAAASIRIHGTRLAEMPFIGTRHIYRRQGMCRRLLHAVELALSSLQVQKLVIPAVSELMHTWTTVFGFKPLEESHKQEVKTLNILVFPSTDLLQKPLLSDNLKGNMTKNENNDILPDVSESTDIGSVEADMFTNCDPAVNNGVSSVGSGLKHPTSSTCDTSDVMNNPSDDSLETLPDGALDMGADCDHAVDDGVSSLGTSPREPTGSPYDTSDMMNNLSDASLETVPGASSACLAPESQFRPHCGVLRDSTLETGKDLISCSPVDSKLQNLADDKLCEDDVEAAAVELDLSPFHDTSRKDNDHLDTDSGNGSRPTEKGFLERNRDWNEQNVQKLENNEDLCSVEPGTCALDKGTDYSRDRNCEASSIQTGLHDPTDSLHETYDIIDKPTDATIVSIHDGSSKESGPDTNNLLRHVDNDTKVHVDGKPSSGLFVESKLQKFTGDIVPEAKREAMAVECDLHPFDGTSLRHRSKVNSSCLNAFSANCKSGGDHVQSNSKLDEHVHTVECKSEIDLFQLGSLACDHKVNTAVSVTEPGWNDPSGPTCAASGMKDNPSGFGHTSAHSDECDLEPKLLLPCMNIKLDMQTKMSTDSKLLNLNEYDAVEENVQGASDECTNADSNYSNPVTGNIFQPANGKLVGRNPNFKENNIHALGCISLEVYHVPSEVSAQSTSLESTEREINEVKTEVLKVYRVTSDVSALSTSQERTERDVNEVKTEDIKVPSHL